MPDLTPMTREEKFLNGDTDLTPITRREHFYAGTESTLPEPEPITREEWFIQKYRGGGGGDITVESLSVTENGTYTAPSGKAYSPVSVNVPLPQNAYLLKSVPNLPQAIASFNDGQDMVMPSLKVAIEPVQDLHGYDAPWVGGAGKNKYNCTFTSQTISGVALTVNNGIITVGSDAGMMTDITIENTLSLTVGNYILNGCPSGGGVGKYRLWVKDITTATYYNDDGDGISFEVISGHTYMMQIRLWGGYGSGLVFKPMIRLASVQDATFAPYSNICPIIGWDDVEVTVADDTTDPTIENVYTIDLDGTRYGGELSNENGVQSLDDGYDCFELYEGWNWVASSTYLGAFYIADSSTSHSLKPDAPVMCTHAKNVNDLSDYVYGTILHNTAINIRIMPENATVQDFKNYIVEQRQNGTPIKVRVQRATPLTIQLTPTAVKSLPGQNNVRADTGDIKDAEYFSKEV